MSSKPIMDNTNEWQNVTFTDSTVHVFDWGGRSRESWQQDLHKNKAELAFCLDAFETAYRQEYPVYTKIRERINELRVAIFWAEWKLSKD